MSFHYEETFENLDRWILRPADHADWRATDGAFVGHWLARFNSLVFDRPIGGDASLEVDIHVLPFDWSRTLNAREQDDPAAWAAEQARKSAGQKNFNILWMASGPNGEDFHEAFDEWFGKGKMGLAFFRTYFFTLTLLWARMRRCPGYELLNDRQDARSEIGEDYRIRIEQSGNRFTYRLNDELVHDVVDPNAYRRGRLGFILSTSHMRVSRLVIDSEE